MDHSIMNTTNPRIAIVRLLMALLFLTAGVSILYHDGITLLNLIIAISCFYGIFGLAPFLFEDKDDSINTIN